MSIIAACLPCLARRQRQPIHREGGEKQPLLIAPKESQSWYDVRTQEDTPLAKDILAILLSSNTEPREVIRDRLRNEHRIRTASFYSNLAERILEGLKTALESGSAKGAAIEEAYKVVKAQAEVFIKKHPILTEVALTLIALGVLYLLLPWVIEYLGFSELGPIEGM